MFLEEHPNFDSTIVLDGLVAKMALKENLMSLLEFLRKDERRIPLIWGLEKLVIVIERWRASFAQAQRKVSIFLVAPTASLAVSIKNHI